MKVENTLELLKRAKAEKYAVPAINVDNIDTITTVFEVAHKKKSPVIIQLSPVQVYPRFNSYKLLIKIIDVIAEEFDVDYAVHLDHGTNIKDILKGIKAGFTSVMYDGSKLSFGDNLNNTKYICKNKSNISVEGELGIVPGTEGIIDDSDEEYLYTNVEEAKEFTEKTGIDFLAIGIGNAHGFYKNKPSINFQRLKEISEVVDIPLVLHGASGLSDNIIKKVIKNGICKINFFTQVDVTYKTAILVNNKKEPELYTFDLFNRAKENIKPVIEHIFDVCGGAELNDV